MEQIAYFWRIFGVIAQCSLCIVYTKGHEWIIIGVTSWPPPTVFVTCQNMWPMRFGPHGIICCVFPIFSDSSNRGRRLISASKPKNWNSQFESKFNWLRDVFTNALLEETEKNHAFFTPSIFPERIHIFAIKSCSLQTICQIKAQKYICGRLDFHFSLETRNANSEAQLFRLKSTIRLIIQCQWRLNDDEYVNAAKVHSAFPFMERTSKKGIPNLDTVERACKKRHWFNLRWTEFRGNE